MSDPYIHQVLRVIVAQICQTIGWHSIQTTPLELLVDILHKYLQEITRNIYRYTELYNRIEPNLDDVGLAFRELNVNLNEIEEYVNYVQPVPCQLEVPKFPIHKESNLNFLKPGNKEVVTRSVHIPEHFPPINPEKEDDNQEKQLEICDTTTDNVIEVKSNQNEIDVNENNNLNEFSSHNKNNNGNNHIVNKGNEENQHTFVDNSNTNKNNLEDRLIISNEIDIINSEINDSALVEVAAKENVISNDNTSAICDKTKLEKNYNVSSDTTVQTSTENPENINLNSTILQSSIGTTTATTSTIETGTVLSNSSNNNNFDDNNSNKNRRGSLSKFMKPHLPNEFEGRPTREISSVIMTLSGFISPAREGKLPDPKIPVIIEHRMIRTPSPPLKIEPISLVKTNNSNKFLHNSALNVAQLPVVSAPTMKSGQQKQDKSSLKQPPVDTHVSSDLSCSVLSNSNQTKSNNSSHSQMIMNSDAKLMKKFKRKMLAHEKEQKKMDKLHKNLSASKQLQLQKQHQKIIKQQQKQMLKFQKQQKLSVQAATVIVQNASTVDSLTVAAGANQLNPIITNSDVIMPTLVMLPDGRIPKLSKKQKGLLRKKRMLMSMIHNNRKNTKDDPSRLMLPNPVASSTNLSTFEIGSNNDSGFDKQPLALQRHKKKQQISLETPTAATSKLTSSIIAQQQVLVAQLAATAGLSVAQVGDSSISASFTDQQNFDDIKIIDEATETSKLNVFKKLSSTKKESNVDSTNLPLDQFIHLPSGTTITPSSDISLGISSTIAPITAQVSSASKTVSILNQQTLVRQPKLPTDTDQIICIDDDENNFNASKQVIKTESLSPRSELQQQFLQQQLIKNSSDNDSSNRSHMNTVNQPILQHTSKSEKKLKRKHQQNEPLNLSNDKINHSQLMSANAENKKSLQEFYLEQQMRIQQQYALATKMMKKERKKPKLKEGKKGVQSNLNQHTSAAAAVLAAAHQQYIQNLAVAAAATSSSSASPLNPSPSSFRPTENLAAINKKLLKIDTVMQPTPVVQGTKISTSKPNKSPQSMNNTNSTTSSGNSGLMPKQKSNPSSLSNAANALASLQFPYPPFPYSFPTRPGLIPTPGIFPPLALVDQFLPFSKFNSMKSTNANLDEFNKISSSGINSSNFGNTQQLVLDAEQNYCNVAPLVPESMIQNFKASPVKSSKQNKQKSLISVDLAGAQKAESRLSNYQLSNKQQSNKVSTQNILSSNIDEARISNINADTPIEISDDEKMRSDSEDKIIPTNESFETVKFTQNTLNESDLRNLDMNNPMKMSLIEDSHRKTADHSIYSNKTNQQESNTSIGSLSGYTDLHNLDINDSKHQIETGSDNINTDFGGSLSSSSHQKHEKRKEHHKKNKKTKDGKIKKKKDKKDKSKSKDKSEKRKDKEERTKDKEKFKKQKKEKKKEKLRQMSIGSITSITSVGSSMNNIYNDGNPNTNIDMSTAGVTLACAPTASILTTSTNSSNYHNASVSSVANSNVSSHDSSTNNEFVNKKQINSNTDDMNSDNCVAIGSNPVPKLTLILGVGKRSPTPVVDTFESNRKFSIKSQDIDHTNFTSDHLRQHASTSHKREPSPELARISPLVTRPPKQKSKEKDKISETESSMQTSLNCAVATAPTSSGITNVFQAAACGNVLSHQFSHTNGAQPIQQTSLASTTIGAATTLQPQTIARGPGRPKGSGNKQHQNSATGLCGIGTTYSGALTATIISSTTAGSSGTTKNSYHHNQGSDINTLQHQTLYHGSATVSLGRSVTQIYPATTKLVTSLTSNISGNSSRPSNLNSTDADGNQVWICPACGRVDDGTPMIGCDGCDAWYHWVCVGIQVPPDDSEDWYCRVCIAKKQASHESDKKKKRKKKSKQTN